MPKSKRAKPGLQEERRLWRAGLSLVAGIDEAGRGAWAGPVFAAAVILPHDACLPSQVRDSKQLSPAQREALYPLIGQAALAWSVGQADQAEIDTLGIVPATRLAMTRAVGALGLQPDALLIDAVRLPDTPLPQRVLYHADALCLSVAAASILAKVSRDRWMVELDARYPGYLFAQHKGYGTRAHRQALARLGVSPVHRRSYRPVAARLALACH
ncbi:MAG: ribonuclease HII [Thermoflexales bacterium]|nr:ribonuclease HII [Thermoflexales bacterium]